nr:hypothetical protein RVX_2817 [Nitratidesulfovibrio sp. HK-II]
MHFPAVPAACRHFRPNREYGAQSFFTGRKTARHAQSLPGGHFFIPLHSKSTP